MWLGLALLSFGMATLLVAWPEPQPASSSIPLWCGNNVGGPTWQMLVEPLIHNEACHRQAELMAPTQDLGMLAPTQDPGRHASFALKMSKNSYIFPTINIDILWQNIDILGTEYWYSGDTNIDISVTEKIISNTDNRQISILFWLPKIWVLRPKKTNLGDTGLRHPYPSSRDWLAARRPSECHLGYVC